MNQCTLHFFFHNKTIVPTLKIKKKKKIEKLKAKKQINMKLTLIVKITKIIIKPL